MFDPQIRPTWDKSIKSMNKHDGKDDSCIIHTVYSSPMLLVVARDIVDKRMSFMHNGVFYSLATSIEDIVPPEKDVIRCKNYMNLFTLSEDEENYYFVTYNQADIKVIWVLI
jgi:hypothetical protein